MLSLFRDFSRRPFNCTRHILNRFEFDLVNVLGDLKMASIPRPLAIFTGASSGICYELAKLCTEHGFDLLIAADEPGINDVEQEFNELGVEVKGKASRTFIEKE